MDIKTSLKIEDYHRGKINLFISGSFVMAYNQSFYFLTELLGRKLKANARYIKRADNRFVVFGGFPLERVEQNYPQAKKTAWGYQLTGKFNLDRYDSWLLQHKLAAKAVANAVTAVVPSCTDNVQGGTTAHKKIKAQKIDKYYLLLNKQQMDFLSKINWQVAYTLSQQDIQFIEGLKQLAINHKAFVQNQ